MPPPNKPGPLKKRKSSKRDNGSRAKSAPTTPTKEEAGGFRQADMAFLHLYIVYQMVVLSCFIFYRSDESDSEFGFDSQWSMPRI